MRWALTAALCAFSTVTAFAQTIPPGYTQFDVAQQAKMRADVGTWVCVSVPAPTIPLTLAETEEGTWFVTRERGDNPATTYERWSHALKAYVLLTIFDSGASNVSRTTSLDPDNATWNQMWPEFDNLGRNRFDSQVTRSGNVLRSVGHFYDDQGRVQISTTTCTKR
jgi:hypothetical protein